MKMIEKLLMENEVRINETSSVYFTKGIHKNILHITIETDKPIGIKSKEQLLSEVPAAIFISPLEWELMNHWKDNECVNLIRSTFNPRHWVVEAVNKDGISTGTVISTKDTLFNFLEIEERYDLEDLISRAVLIEG